MPRRQVPFYLVALFILPISVRLVLTWLYNSTGRSVPIVGLAHAGLGVAAGTAFIPVLAPTVDPVFVFAGFAVLAAVVLVATRGRLGLAPTESATRSPGRPSWRHSASHDAVPSRPTRSQAAP